MKLNALTAVTVRRNGDTSPVQTAGKRWRHRIDDALNALDRPAAILLFLLPVFVQWIIPLVRSRFWLDETVTWWTTNGGLKELAWRCTLWPGSILYNVFILLFRSLGADREWLLRLPSLLAVALAAALLFDLAKRWFSQRVAIAALVFFCTQPWVSFAAADMRPYGFGLLMVIIAVWLMLRWMETSSTTCACAYGAAAASILHFHMLFATALVFQSLFLVFALPRRRESVRQAVLAAGVLAMLALPLLPQYLHAFRDRGMHTFYNAHRLTELGRQFLPTIPMTASALFAAFLPRWHAEKRVRIAGTSVLLAILWAAVPMCLLYAASRMSRSDLFVGRYVLPAVPGLALCFGLILEYLSPRLRTGLVLLLFLGPRAMDFRVHPDLASHTSSGDWAAAIALVDRENRSSRVPALMRSPFPESDYWDWRAVQTTDSALYAPLSFYRSSTDWRPLPSTFTPDAGRAIDHLLEAQRAKQQGFFFVEVDDRGPRDAYLAYFRRRLGDNAEWREIGRFEGVRVFQLKQF